MVADMGSLQLLPHLIGEGITRALALTGKDIDAERALAIGLVSEVVDDDQALALRARELAQQIAENPPLVVRGIKEVMNARLASAQREGLEYVAVWNAAFLQSKDLVEAIGAFAERRPPRFVGE
jgi:enoyl-CoA hydratase